MKSYYQLIRHNGNQDLFHTVEMSITALASGYPFHIHAEGLRGTGKTTIMRAVREILPPIIRVKNCTYNCHPAHPHCPDHRYLSPEQIAQIGTEIIPCPFLEISHSAKIGTVVGSINLSKLTDSNQPQASLLPGTIPQAHRGIIFIDEINRLADTSPEIADILLDVMGTKPGKVQLEESGLPTVSMPVNVTVWAASNPDEDPGPLSQVRRQLSDRFDLSVRMGRPSSYEDIMAILNRNSLAEKKEGNKKFTIPTVNYGSATEDIKKILASIYVDFSIESLRAVEGMELAAELHALLSGRETISIDDIEKVVPYVLGHRTDETTIASILKYLERYKNSIDDMQEKVSTSASTFDTQTVKNAEPVTSSFWKRFCASLLNKCKTGINGNISRNRSELHNSGTSTSQVQSNIADQTCLSNGLQVSNLQPSGLQPRAHQSPVTAPPKCAIPLAKHAIDKFVQKEDKN